MGCQEGRRERGLLAGLGEGEEGVYEGDGDQGWGETFVILDWRWMNEVGEPMWNQEQGFGVCI